MVRRSIIIDGKTTSLSIEALFWEELERQAGEWNMNWQDYTRSVLTNCSSDVNRSSFIREAVLKQLRYDLPEDNTQILSSSWMVDHSGRFKRFNFQKGRIFIGRGKDNDIHIADNAISKRHLLMVFDKVNWWAIDIGSKNGTWTHDAKPIKCTIIQEGRAIHIGNSKIIYMP